MTCELQKQAKFCSLCIRIRLLSTVLLLLTFVTVKVVFNCHEYSKPHTSTCLPSHISKLNMTTNTVLSVDRPCFTGKSLYLVGNCPEFSVSTVCVEISMNVYSKYIVQGVSVYRDSFIGISRCGMACYVQYRGDFSIEGISV